MLVLTETGLYQDQQWLAQLPYFVNNVSIEVLPSAMSTYDRTDALCANFADPKRISKSTVPMRVAVVANTCKRL